jgi:hypothetical protein
VKVKVHLKDLFCSGQRVCTVWNTGILYRIPISILSEGQNALKVAAQAI